MGFLGRLPVVGGLGLLPHDTQNSRERQSAADVVTAEETRAFTEELRARARGGIPPTVATSGSRLFSERTPEQRKEARQRLQERLRGRELNFATLPPAPPPKGAEQPARAARRRERKPSVQRDRAANEAWAKRVLEKWQPLMDRRERAGLAWELRLIPRDVWRTSWKIVGDASGAAARAAWRGVAPLLRVRMLRAALSMHGASSARYSWARLRARRICALAWALQALAKRGRRRGQWAGGLVCGVTRNALCHLLRDPYEPSAELAVPSVSALAGTHRVGATVESGELGYMMALKAAGFCYSQRVGPASNPLPCERWGAWCSARYWLAAGVYERAVAEFGVDAGALLEFSAGWVRDGLEPALGRLLALPPPTATA